MPNWKIFIAVVMALTCLCLGFSVIIVPMTEEVGEHWILVTLGLVVATGVMGTLLALFLRSADRKFSKF